ncbi:sugar ABC transporter substrate-binding protein [Paenibacillus hexagrammi]|uniref:Maltodextrin-binding protein n=1 Tax=Paenibacillus hexagrammi TaxID=2908839 RepID=A0ABY3SKV7_9BACL|nr:maltose ABC transporter substrate-binding protein [Paenibacillus sp. YPD9-1]UJF34488.1 maltose ABC transporter substrate-binding protein [Paenibacillus sp. YPD9-1]
MTMKKMLVVVTAVTTSLALAACGAASPGSTDKENPPVSAETAAPNTEGAQAGADDAGITPEPGAKLLIWDGAKERPFEEEIAKQFSAKYNVEVQIEEVGPPDTVNRMSNDGPAGIGADVFVIPHNHLGRAVNAGLVLPNDIFGDVTKKSNTESAVIGATSGDKIYAYPRSAETIAMYYNKKLVPTPPKSFDDVVAFSKTFTDKSKNKYGLIWESGNFYFNYPFFAAGGGYVFGKNGTDPHDIGLNTDGAVAGLKLYASLKNDVLPINAGDINPDIKRSLFTKGDAAMDITGPWEMAAYKEALGDDLGIAPIPQINGKPAITFAGIQEVVVNAYSKYPNAAKLYAKFSTSKEAQLQLYKIIGSVPTNTEAQGDAQIKNDPYVSAFVEQSKNSIPMPSIPEMESVWSPIGAALSDIWNSGKDPKEALDNAVKQIKDANSSSAK